MTDKQEHMHMGGSRAGAGATPKPGPIRRTGVAEAQRSPQGNSLAAPLRPPISADLNTLRQVLADLRIEHGRLLNITAKIAGHHPVGENEQPTEPDTIRQMLDVLLGMAQGLEQDFRSAIDRLDENF